MIEQRPDVRDNLITVNFPGTPFSVDVSQILNSVLKEKFGLFWSKAIVDKSIEEEMRNNDVRIDNRPGERLVILIALILSLIDSIISSGVDSKEKIVGWLDSMFVSPQYVYDSVREFCRNNNILFHETVGLDFGPTN